MEKTTKAKLQEVQETITRISELREQTLRYLDKYPNDKIHQEYLAKYDSLLDRATGFVQAVNRK